MNYAPLMGPETSSDLKVGNLARVDPIVSRASVIASETMLKVAQSPRAARKNLIRIILNAKAPGMGDAAVAQIDRLTSTGVQRNQAIFDGIRLAVANRLQEFASMIVAAQGGLSGLGSTARDMRSAGCMVSGLAATSAGFINLARANSSDAIVSGATAGANIHGCGIDMLDAQTRAAQGQGQQAIELARIQAALAASQSALSADQSARLVKYGIAGVGLIGLLVIGYAVVK